MRRLMAYTRFDNISNARLAAHMAVADAAKKKIKDRKKMTQLSIYQVANSITKCNWV